MNGAVMTSAGVPHSKIVEGPGGVSAKVTSSANKGNISSIVKQSQRVRAWRRWPIPKPSPTAPRTMLSQKLPIPDAYGRGGEVRNGSKVDNSLGGRSGSRADIRSPRVRRYR